MIRTKTWFAAVLAALAAVAAAGSAARADDLPTIDEALLKKAPDILDALRGQKHCHVGVLKFLVAVGDGKPQDNVGAINRSLADRLEVALVLAMKPGDEKQMDVLLHASEAVAASGDVDLNHRTPEGRMAFFPKDGHGLLFTLPWGNAKPAVHADAFLTGDAVVAADWRSIKVRIQEFDKDNAGDKEMKTLAEFTAVTELRTLSDCGVSFARSKGMPNPKQHQAAPEQVALAVPPPELGSPDTPPAVKPQQVQNLDKLLSDSPVQLTVLYGGVAQSVEGGVLKTPESGKVAFRLKNITDSNGDKPTTYGVVLKINGENSIDHQRLDDLYCYKWVLKPGKEITVEGFQTNDKEARAFKVLPPEQSKGEEIYYDEDKLGVIKMVLFKPTDKDTEAFVQDEQASNLPAKSIGRGSLDCLEHERPGDLAALKDKLMGAVDPAKALEGGRGLISAGERLPSATEQVDFKPYPAPERSIILRYYQPAKSEK